MPDILSNAIQVGAIAAGAAIGGPIGGAGGAVIGALVATGVSYASHQALGLETGENASRPATKMLINQISNVSPVGVLYGSRRVGGTIVYAETSGWEDRPIQHDEYLHLIIVLCEGEVDSIGTVYYNGKNITGSRYTGHTAVIRHTGSDGQAADTLLRSWLPESWTADHRLQGLAYLYCRLGYDPDVYSGIPTITADVEGVEVFDPRDDSTAHSDNPALCIRDYLTNTRYGCGIDESLLDDDSFGDAADECEISDDWDGTGDNRTQYTCSGIIDTDQPLIENLRRLLTSCRGMLVYNQGQYQLLIDKIETPASGWDEDTIIGEVRTGMGSTRSMFNRVRARFFNPDRSWQPDFAVVDSTEMRTQDNGRLLERQIELPFTTSEGRAKHISIINLNQSREPLTVEFGATLGSLAYNVGDVRNLTHETYGWTNKPFRITRMALRNDDNVQITAIEYDDDVYSYEFNLSDDEPDTDLPDPFTVEAPGAPAITEEKYVTTDGAGVKVKATVTWAASENSFLRHYWLEYKKTLVYDWTAAPPTTAARFEIMDIDPGAWAFRVRAENGLGVMSDWSSTTPHRITGLGDVPDDISDFSLSPIEGLGILSWAPVPNDQTNLDVRIGGHIRIRHTKEVASPTWADGQDWAEVPGSATTLTVPLAPGTYMAKAVDSTGIESANAVMVESDGAASYTLTSVGSLSCHTAWAGTFVQTIKDGTTLKLDSSGGEVYSSGSYLDNSAIDITTSRLVQIGVEIEASAEDTRATIDDRTANMDDWPSFDGDDDANANVEAWVTWADTVGGLQTDWVKVSGAVNLVARYFGIKLVLTSENTDYNIVVDTCTMTAYDYAYP